MTKTKPHHIAFLGFDRIQLLDLVGPLEAFRIANQAHIGAGYETSIVSKNTHFTSESNITVHSDCCLEDARNINTLFIPGGAGTRDNKIAQPVKAWLAKNFNRIERVVTVCTGIFIAADLPYLANKEVVTHWGFSDKLQQQNPQLKVNRDRLFIRQGKFFSAAGILSGIDLALNLIERDYGVDTAAYTAKYLVTYLKRSGHQSQFSEPLKFQSINNSHIDRVNRCLMNNYELPMTVAQLALEVHISERHLNRLIKNHFHMSASKYIEHIKLEQSKIYLTKNNTSVELAATKVGYSSSDSFRRSFKRKYGIAPHSYQMRFQ